MVKVIARERLMDMFSRGEKFKLVDVLDKEHFEKEHIKGAISLPFKDIREKAAKILNKDETIVVYCASFDCPASTDAAKELLSLGYRDVLDYKGGLKDYKGANLPMEGSLYESTPQRGAPVCSCC